MKKNNKKNTPLTKLIVILAAIVVLASVLVISVVYLDNKERNDFIDEQVALIMESNPDANEEEVRASIEKNYDTLKANAEEQEKIASNAKPAETEVDVKEEDYPVATIEVKDVGTLEFVLDPMTAPQSVYNFVYLAENNFYDGLTFHRIVPDFVAQGGDPLGTGAGGPGYSIQGEFNSNGIRNELKHGLGSLSMARSTENDSAGSQFYIGLSNNISSLDNDYATFGQITSGQDLLEKLNSHNTEENASDTLTITKVTVDTKGIDYPEPNKLNEDPEVEQEYGLE